MLLFCFVYNTRVISHVYASCGRVCYIATNLFLFFIYVFDIPAPQRAGFTVVAERLNFLRFISHFHAVHRGTAFAGLRTTSVRKLLPEYVLSPTINKVVISILTPCYLLMLLFPSHFYIYIFCTDHGVFFVLFTHLMGSHVDC